MTWVGTVHTGHGLLWWRAATSQRARMPHEPPSSRCTARWLAAGVSAHGTRLHHGAGLCVASCRCRVVCSVPRWRLAMYPLAVWCSVVSTLHRQKRQRRLRHTVRWGLGVVWCGAWVRCGGTSDMCRLSLACRISVVGYQTLLSLSSVIGVVNNMCRQSLAFRICVVNNMCRESLGCGCVGIDALSCS